jgi:hypothetical protein
MGLATGSEGILGTLEGIANLWQLVAEHQQKAQSPHAIVCSFLPQVDH